mmetsp:Transcript_4359/g.11836  ORF Transcript_4359/g.11836 Transcript_4359/m.11836 type:complete len:214 (-) Transcript_4359:543-1184(-)
MLHCPVLEAVEADDCQAAVRGKGIDGSRYGLFKLVDLIIDRDSQGLECTGSRVNLGLLILFLLGTPPALSLHVGEANGLRELLRGADDFMLSGPNDPAGHLAPHFLFSIVSDDAAQLSLRPRVDCLFCAQSSPGVHAHVQGSLTQEAETTFSCVNLHGGHPQVHQHAVHMAVQRHTTWEAQAGWGWKVTQVASCLTVVGLNKVQGHFRVGKGS